MQYLASLLYVTAFFPQAGKCATHECFWLTGVYESTTLAFISTACYFTDSLVTCKEAFTMSLTFGGAVYVFVSIWQCHVMEGDQIQWRTECLKLSLVLRTQLWWLRIKSQKKCMFFIDSVTYAHGRLWRTLKSEPPIWFPHPSHRIKLCGNAHALCHLNFLIFFQAIVLG